MPGSGLAVSTSGRPPFQADRKGSLDLVSCFHQGAQWRDLSRVQFLRLHQCGRHLNGVSHVPRVSTGTCDNPRQPVTQQEGTTHGDRK